MGHDAEMVELIHKYQIDAPYPLFYQSYQAMALIKRLYETLDNAVLVGTSQTDIRWFKNMCAGDVPSVLFRSENADRQLQELAGQNRTLLVVSYYGREETMVRLLERKLKAVCLYEELEKAGFIYTNNLYDIYCEEYPERYSKAPTRDYFLFDINQIFFEHRRRFELEENAENKKLALKKMIFDCAYARDFLTLKDCIDIFCAQYAGSEADAYRLFYKAVEELLHKIKSVLAKRNRRDCAMLWLDYLEYGEDAGMSFLSGLDETAMVFSKVYTVDPVTSHTLKVLFAKRRPVEEESYKLISMCRDNSALLASLEQRGYKFQYYGIGEIGDRFTEEFRAPHFYSLVYSFSQVYWDFICDLADCKTDNSFFVILHELFHTHLPYLSMGLTGDQYFNAWERAGYRQEKGFQDRQCKESREYTDRQLAFWDELLPDNMFRIYMSDHGHTRFEGYHTILKVKQGSLKSELCDSLVSWYDFDKLLLGLLDGRSFEEMEIQNEYVVIQDTEYYGKDFILDCLKKKEIPPLIMPGFQGVVTEQDLFIRYNDGTELYQKMHNDERMVTDQRLEYLRSITSRKRVDLAKEEKFKYSYLIYKVMKRCEARTEEAQAKKLDIVRTEFATIPGGEILALRGGGMGSLRLPNC